MSKTYDINGKTFRYNYDEALLCWIDEEGEVVNAIGLSREDWEDDAEYWCEVYAERIEEELRYLY